MGVAIIALCRHREKDLESHTTFGEKWMKNHGVPSLRLSSKTGITGKITLSNQQIQILS